MCLDDFEQSNNTYLLKTMSCQLCNWKFGEIHTRHNKARVRQVETKLRAAGVALARWRAWGVVGWVS